MTTGMVHIYAFDADGCLYNLRYIKLMIEVLNRHWNFLEYFATKPALDNQLRQFVATRTQAIIREIKTIVIPTESNLAALITHPFFKERYHTLKKVISANHPSYSLRPLEILAQIFLPFIGYMDKLNPNLYKAIFYAANSELILHTTNKIEIQHINHYAVMLGSNRQSFYHDRLSSITNGTHSIFIDLCYLHQKMQMLLKGKKSFLTPFTMADIYGNLPRGESYRKIIYEYLSKKGTGQAHAGYAFDETKLPLVYAMVHDATLNVLAELGMSNLNSLITLQFFDDRLDILHALATVFTAYPRLIPDTVTLELYHYDGSMRHEPIAYITGCGIVDHRYRENVKLMTTLCQVDLANLPKSMNAAATLDINAFLSLRVTGQELIPSPSSIWSRLFQRHQLSRDAAKQVTAPARESPRIFQ